MAKSDFTKRQREVIAHAGGQAPFSQESGISQPAPAHVTGKNLSSAGAAVKIDRSAEAIEWPLGAEAELEAPHLWREIDTRLLDCILEIAGTAGVAERAERTRESAAGRVRPRAARASQGAARAEEDCRTDQAAQCRLKASAIELLERGFAPKEERLNGNGNGKPRDPGPTIHVGGSNNFMLNIGHIRTVRGMRIERGDSPPKRKRASWTDELATLLIDRGDELNLGERELRELAEGELDRRVRDLKELSAEELGRVYQMLSAMKRPALD